MAVLPGGKAARIEFAEERLDKWTANAAVLGIAPEVIDAFTTKVTVARNALTAQGIAKNAAKSATITYHNAVDDMSDLLSDLVKQIKTKADVDKNPALYALADIPAPADPTPVPQPGTPYAFKATLKPDGTLRLDWKCDNPTNAVGVIYHISRFMPETGEYKFLGGNGEKWFIDLTVPAGQPSVKYRVRAARSNSVGDSNEFIVNFGVGAGGMMMASITSANGETPKLAA